MSEHFLASDHSANDITLIPLELIKSVRKAREAGNLYEAENELLYWFSALFKLSALVGNGRYPSVQYQDLAVRSQGKGNLIGNAVLSRELHVICCLSTAVGNLIDRAKNSPQPSPLSAWLLGLSPSEFYLSIGSSMVCSDIWHKYHE